MDKKTLPTWNLSEAFFNQYVLTVLFPQEACKRMTVQIEIQNAHWVFYVVPRLWPSVKHVLKRNPYLNESIWSSPQQKVCFFQGHLSVSSNCIRVFTFVSWHCYYYYYYHYYYHYLLLLLPATTNYYYHYCYYH